MFSLGCSWCFLRLEIFIFLLGLLQVFRNFYCRGLERLLCDWAGQVGSCVFFLVLPTPPLSAGPGVIPLACFLAIFSAVLPTPPLSTGPWSW